MKTCNTCGSNLDTYGVCLDDSGQCSAWLGDPNIQLGQAKGRFVESEPWSFPAEELLPPDIELRNTIFKVVACLGGLAVVSVLFLIF